MIDVLFDTQKMVERLEGAGVPPAQARMHTALLEEAIAALHSTIVEHCASKEDLARLEVRMDTGFKILEEHLVTEAALLRAAISDTRTDLMKWVVTVGILQMALIAGLVLKLAP
jgi:hypothetical protein